MGDWAGLIGAGAGLMMGGHQQRQQDKRDLKQNAKLMAQNIGGQKEIGEFNRTQAMRMFEDTGYGAQKDQMKRAGLNAGLMYKGAGAGGTTGGEAGAVSGGSASPNMEQSGMALGMQSAMMQAQIKNLNADSNLKDVDAGKKGGIDTAVGYASIDKLIAETTNEKAKTALTNVQKSIADVELVVKQGSSEADVESAIQASLRAIAETQRSYVSLGLESATVEAMIEQESLKVVQMGLENAFTKSKTNVSDYQMKMMAETILKIRHDKAMDWEKLGQKEKEIAISKMMPEFNTSLSAKAKQVGEAGKAVGSLPMDIMNVYIKLIDALVPF